MLNDWWADQSVQKILSPTAFENLKYPTQKPEGLLRRIILGHSNPDDLILDCFAGSGTTLSVAKEYGRRFIGIDQNPGATSTITHRILRQIDTKPMRGFQTFTTSNQQITKFKIDLHWTHNLCIIHDFTPTTFLEGLADKPPINDWRELVDSILIHTSSAPTFTPTIIDIPERDAQVTGRYEIPLPNDVIRIRLTDIAGNIYETECLQTANAELDP